MNEDYAVNVVEIYKKYSDTKNNVELVNDYNIIKNVKLKINVNNKDIYNIYNIRNKYREEISIVSNIKSVVFRKNETSATIEDRNNYVSEINFLLEYLPRIMILRLTKSSLKEELKSKLFCDDYKTAYELLIDIV